MNISQILNYTTQHPNTLAVTLFSFLLLYIAYLHYKIARFTRGQSGASLESVIKSCVDAVSEIEKRNELISSHALTLDARVSNALRNAQTIRYKAFEVGGSNQSFSIALLNEKGNGVVISSLHARDRINTFAKPVEKYASSYELTEEELSVIGAAKKEHKG
ncbi:MAG: DUF4446 family protein [Candidatus Paceibacterota bacterium]